MKTKINIREASSIVFPVFLIYAKRRTSDLLEPNFDKKIKKWAKITLDLLNEYYPPDIFTGVSGDKGPTAVVLIRKILTEGLKK
jgi:hypothetical protein